MRVERCQYQKWNAAWHRGGREHERVRRGQGEEPRARRIDTGLSSGGNGRRSGQSGVQDSILQGRILGMGWGVQERDVHERGWAPSAWTAV